MSNDALRVPQFGNLPYFFKFVWGARLDEWGTLGFSPAFFKNARKVYVPDSPVLVAVSRNPPSKLDRSSYEGYLGTIFGVCTIDLDSTEEAARRLANPKMVQFLPQSVQEWPKAFAVKDYWKFVQPLDYSKICGGLILKRAPSWRGRLVRLDADKAGSVLIPQISAVIRNAAARKVPVYSAP